MVVSAHVPRKNTTRSKEVLADVCVLREASGLATQVVLVGDPPLL